MLLNFTRQPKQNLQELCSKLAEYYYYGYPKNYMELNYKETEKLIDYEKARIFYEKALKNFDDAYKFRVYVC